MHQVGTSYLLIHMMQGHTYIELGRFEVQRTGKEEMITVNVGNVRYRHGGGISENVPHKRSFKE